MYRERGKMEILCSIENLDIIKNWKVSRDWNSVFMIYVIDKEV